MKSRARLCRLNVPLLLHRYLSFADPKDYLGRADILFHNHMSTQMSLTAVPSSLLRLQFLFCPYCLKSVVRNVGVQSTFLQQRLSETQNWTPNIIIISAPRLSILYASDSAFSTTVKERSGFNLLLLFLLLLYVLLVSSVTHLDLGFYSKHYLGFGKLNQLLPHVNSFLLSWLLIQTDIKKCQNYQ